MYKLSLSFFILFIQTLFFLYHLPGAAERLLFTYPKLMKGGLGKVNEGKLTPKQRAFSDFYLQSLNAADAARRAGYSAKTAKEMGNENLSKPHIAAYIKERMEQKANDRIMQADEVLERLTSFARGKEPCKPTERIKSLELLGKAHKLFVDKVEQDTMSEIKVEIEVIE